MKFSLVMATIGRDEQIGNFLRSLDTQQRNDVELIIVDQNQDDRVRRVLDRDGSGRTIRHVSSSRGLSHARNVGLAFVTGDIVAFPDDDCEYPPALLAQLETTFRSHPEYDGLLVRVASRESVEIGRLAKRAGFVTPNKVWNRANSSGLFFRRHLVSAVGGFDEQLGVGAGTPWGAAEDADYPLRAVRAGFRLYYDPGITVWHPDVLAHGYRRLIPRAESYGAGWGYAWRKHKAPWWVACYYLLRPLGGAVVAIGTANIDRARFHLAIARGRLRGWLANA